LPFLWNAEAQRHADVAALRALFRAALQKAGDEVWLASALQKPLAYASKISEAVNAIGDRKIQLEWLAPMLQDPRAQDLIVAWVCDRCGFEQPERRKQAGDQDELEAFRKLAREPGPLGEVLRTHVDKALGRGKI
jgi:hypothetical protein